MSTSNKTYNPVQSLSIRATADLPAFRFISFSGALCANETRAAGVTEVDWVNGENAAVVSLGTIAIETSESVTLGADVTCSGDGKAKPASGTMPVNGRALDACTGAGFIRIKLVP